MVLGRSRRKWLQLPLMRVGGEDNAMPLAPQLSMLHCGGEAKKLNTKHASLRTGVEGVERGRAEDAGRKGEGCAGMPGGMGRDTKGGGYHYDAARGSEPKLGEGQALHCG